MSAMRLHSETENPHDDRFALASLNLHVIRNCMSAEEGFHAPFYPFLAVPMTIVFSIVLQSSSSV